MEEQEIELERIRGFYDGIYYREAQGTREPVPHYMSLASKIGVAEGQKVLDVACGLGQWLSTCATLGAIPHGIDLSERAIQICRKIMPHGTFQAHPAETLPFADQEFDLVSCLGSLEHFVDQKGAVKEMVRVAKPGAQLVILVPNEDFLTRKLGLYSGTYQVAAKEVMHSLAEWEALFEECGLEVKDRWRDLHVLSRAWIFSRGLLRAPIRAAQAMALAIWPLKWQYQVYHLCTVRKV